MNEPILTSKDNRKFLCHNVRDAGDNYEYRFTLEGKPGESGDLTLVLSKSLSKLFLVDESYTLRMDKILILS